MFCTGNRSGPESGCCLTPGLSHVTSPYFRVHLGSRSPPSLHPSDGAVIDWAGKREILAYLSHLFGESVVMMLEAMSSQAMPVFILLFKYRD